jgi:hypothetical protein
MSCEAAQDSCHELVTRELWWLSFCHSRTCKSHKHIEFGIAASAERSSQDDEHGDGSCEQDAAEQEVAVGHFPPGLLGSMTNGELKKWGLSRQVCQDITNPGMPLFP